MNSKNIQAIALLIISMAILLFAGTFVIKTLNDAAPPSSTPLPQAPEIDQPENKDIITSETDETPEPTDPISKKTSSSDFVGYEEGKLLVIFEKNVTLKQAEQLIKNYNLKSNSYLFGPPLRLRLLTVEVPIGEEDEWVMLLNKIDIVEQAYLNLRGSLQ